MEFIQVDDLAIPCDCKENTRVVDFETKPYNWNDNGYEAHTDKCIVYGTYKKQIFTILINEYVTYNDKSVYNIKVSCINHAIEQEIKKNIIERE